MTSPPRDQLVRACEALAQVDPALARAYREHGVPVWRVRPPVYATLAQMIAGQQISTKAAAAIWARTEAFFGDVTAEAILEADPETLRGLGWSRPKVEHLCSIARALTTGTLDLARVGASSRNSAHAELLSVRGIGPWTAELFLLYALGEMDAFPPGDIGLMEAHKLLGDYETRMDIKAFITHAETWQPHRGVAAHLLWGWLNDRRNEADTAGQPLPTPGTVII